MKKLKKYIIPIVILILIILTIILIKEFTYEGYSFIEIKTNIDEIDNELQPENLNLENIEGPKMHTVEIDTYKAKGVKKRIYDTKIKEVKRIGYSSKLKVLDIDDEGILVKYVRDYYVTKSDEENLRRIDYSDYKFKTETVRQKLKWNVNYVYKIEEHPSLQAEGGTDYYVRFEK